MRKVTISACQFRVERAPSFDAFKQQVTELMDQVPPQSDYVIFPELFTVGLLTSFEGSDAYSAADLVKIDQYTEDYKHLFGKLAKDRQQVIIAGSHLERRGDKYYNIAYIFKPDGTYVEHKKTHIFPAEANWQTSEGDELQVYDIGPAKIALAVCYEAEIPEISRIHSINGAEIIFCPSYTFTEYGFWRVRHCAQARCIENQVYFVHCPTVGEPGSPLPNGFGRASILSPCDTAWSPDGVVAEAETNVNMVVTGVVDLDELYVNRKTGAATTFVDRTRRENVYTRYEPYKSYNRK
ncbi:nitrilase-related carbon-nitrogen hydrolase [Paenibacillus validus]|uniref:Amidohydrolase n=1 Tax=Paenibacillus validus TaxID=44253 RepID=A0A7X2ZB90_9BACL|nr:MULTISPECIES: nitrilase-related carbon-nitrogen hydrolase [Paenibacillus]MED4600471.1 nitrilase-related carbon-nitrogen hydrolase [Paenibacillus validus]MED4604730.1 nitrilase-related carbon-nitrogen hydrolase [Paenibacillus validus]MUG71048.1 amidohydrolase [Paenibacillus validus]